MKKIKTWDKVIVIAGTDKGTISTVTAVKWDKILVKGVHTVKKSKKWAWIIEKDLPVHISNIALYDATAKAASRVWYKTEKWKKMRVYKKSNTLVGVPAKQ